MINYKNYPVRNYNAVIEFLTAAGYKFSAISEYGQGALAHLAAHVKEVTQNGVTIQAVIVDDKVIAAAQIHQASGQSREVPAAHLAKISQLFK